MTWCEPIRWPLRERFLATALDEGMSTRLLIYAGQLIEKGIEPEAACRMALVRPLTDDPDMRDTLDAAVGTFF